MVCQSRARCCVMGCLMTTAKARLGSVASCSRLFLASIALLVGCGAPMGNADASASDATVDSADATTAAQDASSGDSDRRTATRAERPRECPASAPIADTFNWAPPRVRRGSCTTEQVQRAAQGIQTLAISEANFRPMLGDSCYECVFSDPESDTSWGPVLEPSGGNPFWYLNLGGCMIAAGASTACGIAANDYPRCAYAACDGCPLPDLDACVYGPNIYADGGACSAVNAQYRRACARTASQYQRCYGAENIAPADWNALVINELCGPTTTADAGM